MTRLLIDVASYQGALAPAGAAAAGFTAVNLKTSHGLTQKSVHERVGWWAQQAASLGLGISTFHYLDNTADGGRQARYAYARLTQLGLTRGTAHQVDCESTGTETILRDYVETMTALLGRPIAVYTGDWWWKPRGWNVADQSPHLWSAPNAGYLTAYPGDASPAWRAGYGGWPVLSVMQYAVRPLAGVNVSMSAIRDESVWLALTTGRTAPTMTTAPATIRAERALVLQCIPSLDPLSVGIVGNAPHAATGTSYHLGKSDLRADAYSVVESPRDHHPTEDASAIDVGYFKISVKGKTHDLRSYSAWLVAQCVAGAPDTLDIREVIWSPDGLVVKRWDRLGIRTSGDSSHLQHTHKSYFRDSLGRDKTALTRRYFTEIGLLEGDDMTTKDEFLAWVKDPAVKAALGDAFGGHKLRIVGAKNADGSDVFREMDTVMGWLDLNLTGVNTAIAKVLNAVVTRDDVDEAAVAEQAAPLVAAQVIAAVTPLIHDGEPVTQEKLAGALLKVMQDAFAAQSANPS